MKPANFLFAKGGQLKLAEIGLSRFKQYSCYSEKYETNMSTLFTTILSNSNTEIMDIDEKVGNKFRNRTRMKMMVICILVVIIDEVSQLTYQ